MLESQRSAGKKCRVQTILQKQIIWGDKPIDSSFEFRRVRPERPTALSPGQAKRHPGYRVLEQSRPVRAKALILYVVILA